MRLTDSARPETLSTYMSTAWSGDGRYDGLDAVIAAIAEGAQQIQQKVQAATLAGVIGTTGETNVQGEIVQLLDTAASDTFVDVLSGSGRSPPSDAKRSMRRWSSGTARGPAISFKWTRWTAPRTSTSPSA